MQTPTTTRQTETDIQTIQRKKRTKEEILAFMQACGSLPFTHEVDTETMLREYKGKGES